MDIAGTLCPVALGIISEVMALVHSWKDDHRRDAVSSGVDQTTHRHKLTTLHGDDRPDLFASRRHSHLSGV